jgi:hypothetical protein
VSRWCNDCNNLRDIFNSSNLRLKLSIVMSCIRLVETVICTNLNNEGIDGTIFLLNYDMYIENK